MEKPIVRDCLYCGKLYVARGYAQKYCCEKCRDKASDLREKEKEKQKDKKAFENLLKRKNLSEKQLARAKEVDSKRQSFAELCRVAKEHGMTYGQYVAWLENQKAKEKV